MHCVNLSFGSRETETARALVALAVREDFGELGDITSLALLPADAWGSAVAVARASGVVAGLPVAHLTCHTIDPRLTFQPLIGDGERVVPGQELAQIHGPLRSLLAAERIVLNFLQRLSGIATQTRNFVDQLAGLPTRVLDTRKSPPGWRLLDKYAFRVGGGQNHRLGLHDMILIKDNHLAALRYLAHPIATAIRQARAAFPGVALEIEVDSPDQLKEALSERPDFVLLDNMNLAQLRECVQIRRDAGVKTLLEASGGITLDNVRAVAATGVDRISIGAVTHSVPALDIALDFVSSGGGIVLGDPQDGGISREGEFRD